MCGTGLSPSRISHRSSQLAGDLTRVHSKTAMKLTYHSHIYSGSSCSVLDKMKRSKEDYIGDTLTSLTFKGRRIRSTVPGKRKNVFTSVSNFSLVFCSALLVPTAMAQSSELSAPSYYDRSFSGYRRLTAEIGFPEWFESFWNIGPQAKLYLGIFLTVAGSLFMAGGSTLMKLGVTLDPNKGDVGTWTDSQWLWGFSGKNHHHHHIPM